MTNEQLLKLHSPFHRMDQEIQDLKKVNQTLAKCLAEIKQMAEAILEQKEISMEDYQRVLEEIIKT